MPLTARFSASCNPTAGSPCSNSLTRSGCRSPPAIAGSNCWKSAASSPVISVSPCHRRVKLLEERGVITRYIATVDQKSLGLHVSVFISIKLARQKEEDLNRFAKAISKWDEVLECYLMTGNRDYLLRVVAADLSSYEAFLKNKLTRLDGIASIESSFALSQVKYSIALPV
jgi:Lrp/AsnC family leucine-responsive transcriptional regulator